MEDRKYMEDMIPRGSFFTSYSIFCKSGTNKTNEMTSFQTGYKQYLQTGYCVGIVKS